MLKKMLVVAAAVVVVGGAGTGVALAMQPDEPKAVQVQQVASTEPVEQSPTPVEVAPAPVEQAPAAQQTTPAPQPEPEVVNPFQTGLSGYHVFNRRAEVARPLPQSANEQYSPKVYCEGIASQSVGAPVKYGFACLQNGQGHMVFIEEVNPDGSFWVSEMNSRGQVSMTDPTPAGGFGKVDYKLIPADRTNFYTLYFN